MRKVNNYVKAWENNECEKRQERRRERDKEGYN